MIELSCVSKSYKKGSFFSKEYVTVLKCVDFTSKVGEHVGIIGESGAGKSTLSRIISLLELPDSGKIVIDGNVVTKRNVKDLIDRVGMVFQDPSTSLDPRMTVYSTLKEASKDRDKILSVLDRVNLRKNVLNKYPHELSGGEQQRVAIARALLANSKYIVFDEFTSALDVSTQAKIVNLLCRINESREYGYIFVSHDVSLIGYLSDRVYVIYKGEIVEELIDLTKPLHPYTKTLISAQQIDIGDNFAKEGCSFYQYCPNRMDRCKKEKPKLKRLADATAVRCFLYD